MTSETDYHQFELKDQKRPIRPKLLKLTDDGRNRKKSKFKVTAVNSSQTIQSLSRSLFLCVHSHSKVRIISSIELFHYIICFGKMVQVVFLCETTSISIGTWCHLKEITFLP